jgi:hypothetical protein
MNDDMQAAIIIGIDGEWGRRHYSINLAMDHARIILWSSARPNAISFCASKHYYAIFMNS